MSKMMLTRLHIPMMVTGSLNIDANVVRLIDGDQHEI
jgi:hypothetical protein